MKIATSAEIRIIEVDCMEKSGLPPLVLMENAAHSSALEILSRLPKGSRVAVFCGTGINGGDGMAAARHLFVGGLQTEVYLIGGNETLLPVIKINIRALEAAGLSYTVLNDESDIPDLSHADMVVDALLGIGLSGDVRPLYASIIRAVNNSGKPVFAIDLPSGICADTGRVMGEAIRAQATLTFGCIKRGLVLYPGAEYAGEVLLDRIGLPPSASAHLPTEMPEAEDIRALLPVRAARSHKYSHGRVLSAAGCNGMPGAAVMAAAAAYRAGAGLVLAAATAHVTHILQSWLKEAVTLSMPDEDGMLCDRSALVLKAVKTEAQVALVGPGLTDSPVTEKFVGAFLEGLSIPTVLDADALNILARHRDWLTALTAHAPTILTPHMGEMSRLTGLPAETLLYDTIGSATALAAETGAIVLLKDARTIIASPDGRISINPTGCNALAKAGSGDVLAGLIAGFAAQGCGLFEAAQIACYVHGLAGERAAETLSVYGVTASELLDIIPSVLLEIASGGKA